MKNKLKPLVGIALVAVFMFTQTSITSATPQQTDTYVAKNTNWKKDSQTVIVSSESKNVTFIRDSYTATTNEELTARAAEAARLAAEAAAKVAADAAAAEKTTSPTFTPPNFTPDPGSAQAYAQTAAAANYGWGQEQFNCLVALWSKESGWRANALNSGSGAYGIPQALPGEKMASAGADWATNAETQVNWGLTYISSRYGSPCAAWEHSSQVNWY